MLRHIGSGYRDRPGGGSGIILALGDEIAACAFRQWVPLDELPEGPGVVRLDEVRQFMHDHVVENPGREAGEA